MALEQHNFEDRFGVAIEPIYEDVPVEFYKKYRYDVLEEINAMTSVELPSSDSLLERVETIEGYLPLSADWQAEKETYSRFVSVSYQYLSKDEPYAGVIPGNTSLDDRYPPVGDQAFATE